VAAETRDKDGLILMEYPFETAITLDKKCWVDIAQMLLKQENLKGINIELQPGKWYQSKRSRGPYLGKLVDFVFGPEIIYLYGSHVAYWKYKKKVHEVIHIAVDREDKDILSTLLHEIAHAHHIGDDHGKKWEAEYLRLMDEYYVSSSAGQLYETLVDLYEPSYASTK
jgi:hypothetical protein